MNYVKYSLFGIEALTKFVFLRLINFDQNIAIISKSNKCSMQRRVAVLLLLTFQG